MNKEITNSVTFESTACEHEDMELLDTLRWMVELWGCSDCEFEETRIFYGPFGDYSVA